MAECVQGNVSTRRVLSETIVVVPGFRWCGRAAFAAALMLCLNLTSSNAQTSPPSAPPQVVAQGDVSLEYFHERLAPFGDWLDHPVWGEVWQPNAGPNFRPYFFGYWDYTSDYGSIWISNEPYGDIVYHYGRWVFDLNYGWLWVPGYVWGPSWVVWRANQEYVGWLPMPPGYLDYDQPLRTAPYAGDNWYGYQTFYGPTFVSEYFYTLWVFVENKDFGHSERRRYVTDVRRLRDLFRDSRDRTRYVNERDHVHDGFIDRDWLKREANRDVDPRPAASFFHRNVPVTSVSKGGEIFRNRRANNPDNATPLPLGNSVGSLPPRDFAPRRNQASTTAQPGTGSPVSPPVAPESPGRSKFVRVPNDPGDANLHAPNDSSAAPSSGAPALQPNGAPRYGIGRARPGFNVGRNGNGIGPGGLPPNIPPQQQPDGAAPVPGVNPTPALQPGESAAPRYGIGRTRPGFNFGRANNGTGTASLPPNIAPPQTDAVPGVSAPLVPAAPPAGAFGTGIPRGPGVFHVPGVPVARTNIPSVPSVGVNPVPVPAVPAVAPAIVAPAAVAPAAPAAPAAPPPPRGGDGPRSSPGILRGVGGF